MKERIILTMFVLAAYVLLFTASARHSWWLYGAFVVLGQIYTITVEGWGTALRMLSSVIYAAIAWLLFASIGWAFCWTEFSRRYRLKDLLSLQRGPDWCQKHT